MSLLRDNVAMRLHQIAWWLCIVTLPWIDMANNQSLILLLILWAIDGDFKSKWERLKTIEWPWPFIAYYGVLAVGMLYTQDIDNGLFTLDKKVTFLGLPIVVATGRSLDELYISFLKRCFVYSCSIVVVVCLGGAAYHFLNGQTVSNFDLYTEGNFNTIHPGASKVWTDFSYVQLARRAGLHPAYLSMYLIFSLVILYTEKYQSRVERIVHFSLGILLACFIALLSTRIAIVAFLCVAAFLGIKEIYSKKIRVMLPIGALSSVMFAFLWINPVARFRVMEEPRLTTYQANTNVTQWSSVSYRLLEWQGSWGIIRKHWLTGVGTGDGKVVMDEFYSNYNSSTVGLEHNAHNQYLQVWMESGIVGLALFLWCLFGGLARLWRNDAYVCFIIIFTVMCLTESIGERQKGVVFFMLFQSLFLGFAKKSE